VYVYQLMGSGMLIKMKGLLDLGFSLVKSIRSLFCPQTSKCWLHCVISIVMK
jgi:hypothetical protein